MTDASHTSLNPHAKEMPMCRTPWSLVVVMTVAGIGAENAGCYGQSSAEPAATAPPAAVQPWEAVVDNGDHGFSMEGQWNESTHSPGFIGKNYLWHKKGGK